MKTQFTITIGSAILAWSIASSSTSHAYPPAADQGPPPPVVTDRTELTLSRIYRGDEFNLESTSLKWDKNNDVLLRRETTSEPAKEDETLQIIRRPIGQSAEAPETVLAIPTDPIGSVESYQFSQDERWLMVKTRSQRVWRHHSLAEYWLFDLKLRLWRAISGGRLIMYATFSPNSEFVAFVRDGDLMIENISTGRERVIASSDRADLIHGTFDWVYEEELGLTQGFQFNHDGNMIAFWQVDRSGVPMQTLIDNTSERYPTLKRFAYPKVGQMNSAVRIGVHDLATERTAWMNIDGDPRQNYLAAMQWVNPSREPVDDQATDERLLIQQLNRRQNENRLWVADPETGSARVVHTETSPGWVMHQAELHQLPALESSPRTIDFVWQSEQTGWNHLHRLSFNESLTQTSLAPITSGDWDVIEVEHVDSKTGRVLFTASPNNPTTRGLYVVNANAHESRVSRVSPEAGGTYRYQISPSGRFAITTWSDFQTPPVKSLVGLIPYEILETIDDNESAREALNQLDPIRHEFVQLAIDENVALDAWIMLPAEKDIENTTEAVVPLLVYVYGEPAGQTVRDVYGGKGYLWNRLMVQNGIAVASIDNRGTASPRGRAFRQAVYGKIGVLAPAEQAAGVRRLLARYPILDPERVGVWGWSGGGSSSLHAIFRYPDLFKTAVAVAPVSDQLDYDTIYQERYMGLIDDGREKFVEGSPITHAKKLEGSLLIIHGTGDDNVHYASTQRLIDELVAQGRSFEMMAYPGRSHAITEGSGTVMHLRKTMTDFLLRTLHQE